MNRSTKTFFRSALVAVALGAVAAGGLSAPAAAVPDQAVETLTIPGTDFFPESLAAAANGDLYVSSAGTGAIVRFAAPLNGAPTTFLPAGINPSTAGIVVDSLRGVLWTCAASRGLTAPTALRAFELSSGRAVAEYLIPNQGVCADLTMAGTAVYVTDSAPSNPAATRILRLTTSDATAASGGRLEVWSADARFAGTAGRPQLGGIAFNGQSSLFVTNSSSGRLFRVDFATDGSAQPATEIPLAGRFINPDGIRMFSAAQLLVTEPSGRLNAVAVASGDVSVIAQGLNQPTSVAVVGRDLWVTEGQVLRLQSGQQPTTPFTLRRIPLR